MTRDELRKELKTGVKLEDIFEFTEGQDCLIYKGKFLPGIIGDDICYISDLSLVDIPVNKSIVKSYEIDSVMGRCYTTNDFIKECNGHENIAEDLFNYFLKNDKYETKQGKESGGFAPNWIGQFYALFQWMYKMSSKEVVKLLPVEFMFEAYPGLHDLDLQVAVCKVGEQCGLNVLQSG